ncbi:MAG TPA: hypothetical protein VH082_06885 [Rudaea sp.]|jgi:hypothetical protein|nr:hypothetical protein [Rudaea sp.]
MVGGLHYVGCRGYFASVVDHRMRWRSGIVGRATLRPDEVATFDRSPHSLWHDVSMITSIARTANGG